MNKKILIPIIAVSILLVVAVSVLAYNTVISANSYRANLSNIYTRSLGDFTEHLGNMENALKKAKYTNTLTGQSSIAAVLMESASGAKTAISYLPFSDNNNEVVEKSVSKAADFGLYAESKSVRGEELSEEDYEVFETLLEQISMLKKEFDDIRARSEQGEIQVGNLKNILEQSLNLSIPASFDSELSDLSKEISALPTMIYDGPYSDHVEKREPEFLLNEKEITEDEALEIAAEFLKIDDEELTLKFTDEGSLAAYQFEGEGVSIKITKTGGVVSYMKKDTDTQEASLSYEDALEISLEHFSNSGDDSMKESYYVINDNVCTINFAPTQDEVILYPDLVKVSIELGEGNVVAFSNTGYLMNHRERDDISPKISEEEALNGVSPNLEVKNSNLAIVPTPGENEVLCYEFSCIDKESEQEVLVYINAATGYEESIFLITKSDSGHLVS